MEYICGITFAPFAARGRFATDETKKSLVLMRERTAANFVIFVPNGVQQTAQSEEICYTASATMSDDELEEMIAYAQSLGFRVTLKPTANCANGTWRAHINFSMRMCHANRSGEIGLRLTQNFSFIMQKLHRSVAVRCFFLAVRW